MNIRKVFTCSVLLLMLNIVKTNGQSAEVGLFAGVATYKGELSTSLFNTKFPKPAIGLLYRKNLNNHWAHRVGFTYGSIVADDARSEDEHRQRRNLSFRSSLTDLHYYLEFNFFKYQIANPGTRFTPFIFAGFNLFMFNPQAELNGEWIDLQPLGTEGQGTANYPDRDKYKRFQVAIPFGGGFKFKLTRRFGMTIEAGVRRTFTDYLDDVSTTYADKDVLMTARGETAVLLSDRSPDAATLNQTGRQRGNASNNDWYMFTGLSLNYTLSKKYNDNCSPFKGKLR